MFEIKFVSDLSTLASVVTTLAAMGKNQDEVSTADLSGATSSSDVVLNGEVLSESPDPTSKAIDAITKALQPQLEQVFCKLCILF
jgi:hypothetical protein